MFAFEQVLLRTPHGAPQSGGGRGAAERGCRRRGGRERGCGGAARRSAVGPAHRSLPMMTATRSLVTAMCRAVSSGGSYRVGAPPP